MVQSLIQLRTSVLGSSHILLNVTFILVLVQSIRFLLIFIPLLLLSLILLVLLLFPSLFFALDFGLLFNLNKDISIFLLLLLFHCFLIQCFLKDSYSFFLFHLKLLALLIQYLAFIQSFYLYLSSNYSQYLSAHELILNVINHVTFLETENPYLMFRHQHLTQ